MDVFAADSAYDPAVNTMSTFTTVLSAEGIKGFSPPAIHPMSNTRETGRGNITFIAGAKMAVCAIVRFDGEAG